MMLVGANEAMGQVLGRKRTGDLIAMLRNEGEKKVNGYKKMEILVKGIYYNALPKGESGAIAEDGSGKIDLNAARFILEQIHGKPVERREVAVNIFQHFPEKERLADLSRYEIEVPAKVE